MEGRERDNGKKEIWRRDRMKGGGGDRRVGELGSRIE